MKNEVLVNLGIRAVVFLLGFCGVFLSIGSVGYLEYSDMSFLQFCFQELAAFALIILSITFYANKEILNEHLIKN